MRAVGYDPDVAVADIVDNSLAAGAQHVQVHLDVTGGEHVWILDDGRGMVLEEAVNALRLGNQHAGRARDADDLGRFGLGLKTASFSQARCLTVLTRKDGVTTGLRWDLDADSAKDQWLAEILDDQAWAAVPGYAPFSELASGTLVVWQHLDRLGGDTGSATARMSRLTGEIKEHLALVFHRFLETRAVVITVNGRKILGLDPFLKNHPSTQTAPVETKKVRGQTVEIQGYTLPHRSKLKKAELARPDLTSRLFEFQGFYIYRAKRLISRGGWAGLMPAHHDRTGYNRLRIDIPNTLDDLWQLDVKKETVRPPESLRRTLKTVAEALRPHSERIIVHRGRKQASSDFTYLWSAIEERGEFRYEINTDHPLVRAVDDRLPANASTALRSLLAGIAATVPYGDIHKRMSVDNARPADPFTDEDLTAIASIMLRLPSFAAMSVEECARTLQKCEPFASRMDDLAELTELVASTRP
ncbi:ATP-binding protein [Kocuria rosea]|uniref:ATP-binding protein n=1 Tax=Kocuria rosea TaxID=1275 RepID=UPI001643A157|nr:ATP-binding protein [Kocuria rosea]